ncbi:MAG: cupin domain-containing protein [Syntrophomonadaceae bacterium]|nr:cupin domain-containing protein [Syntrophomonadaceae bacterium]MDD3898495.1 cupin domain-containing protein [Syntrophomonadaceae bacterium]MDD4549879.1 cupin domain-containing protein [Syntrophomonadaceae bacterium]
MFVGKIDDIEKIQVSAPGAANAIKQSLIGPAQGWEGWVMRLFTLESKGHTPRHSHPWPHINYIVGGQGTLFLEGKEYTVETGGIAYVPGGGEHQFTNLTDKEFSFICIVPEEGDK